MKVGLTGGISSGKSTVSTLLKEKNIPVIDADVISRSVLKIYPELNQEIKNYFGQDFYDSSGNLKRKELGNFIFKHSEERKKLESIMLPFIIKEIFKKFNEYDKNGEPLCVLDAPTLIEQDLHKDMDHNILVWVDRATQIERLQLRDNLNFEQALDRINSQMNLDEKKQYVDFIIDNSKNKEELIKQVDEILYLIES